MANGKNQNDHDLLISLNTSFRDFVGQYQVDMKELKDGNTRQLVDHEARIRKKEALTQ